jgi:putative transposase
MHRDMAAELQRHPAWDRARQQDHCDRWRHDFNHVRPHQALELRTPASVYRGSPRLFPTVAPEPVYPPEFETRKISSCGTTRYHGRQRHLSSALVGQTVGFEPLPEMRFRVWFYDICLGEGKMPWRSNLQPLDTNPESEQIELDL